MIPTERAERNRARQAQGEALRIALPVGLAVVVLLLWQYGIRVVGVPRYLVATPTDVAASLVDGFVHGDLLRDTAATLEEILLGFAVGAFIGIALGVLVSWSKLLDQTLTPYIIALNGFPKVAIAPLIVILLGQELTSKIVITALVAFFPLVVNVTAGLHSIRERISSILMRIANGISLAVVHEGSTADGAPAGFCRLEDRHRARADWCDRR